MQDDAEKKGQLTLFVVVAIVIALVMIISFSFVDVSQDTFIDPALRPAHDAVVSCVDEVTEQSLVDVGASGGYFTLPDGERVSEQSIPYYYYEHENLFPSRDMIAEELARYNEALLYFCIQKAYSELGVDVVDGDIDVTVDITPEDTVVFSVAYPFSVVSFNQSYYFGDGFIRTYDVRLYTMYTFMSEMILLHEAEKRAICVNCVSDLALQHELYIDLWNAGDDVLFYVTDVNSLVQDKPYKFYFMIKPIKPMGGEFYDPFENI